MYDLLNKKILILGGSSMLGRASFKFLLPYSDSIYAPTHIECDLLNEDNVNRLFNIVKPNIVISAQGYNGNIEFNKKYPHKIFERTVKMGMNILKVATEYKVDKILSFISSCAYPSKPTLREDEFWNGKPDDSVSAHGFSKRIIIEYAEQLRKVSRLNHIGMVINTVYGPWDSFNSDKTKVVGSLISKFREAKEFNWPFVNLLGNGQNKREFIYCDDVGKALVEVLKYDEELPLINIGNGLDHTIETLADNISKILEYDGHIKWSGKDGGQKQKLLDNKKMMKLFNLSFTPLTIGLNKTIDWYKTNV